MIIDFHTHVFPEKIAERAIAALEANANSRAHIKATIPSLINSMERSGIDISVVLQVVTNPRQTETINRTSVEINEKYADCGLIAFGGIHPDDENYRDTLKFIASNGLKGIKVHPVYQKVDFDDIRFLRILDCATELGLITVTHAGLDIGVEGSEADPEKLRHAIDTVHPKKLVLAHLGGWNQWDKVSEYIAGQDVYLDTAFSIGRPYLPLEGKEPYPHPDLCSKEMLEKLIRLHGEDKILFATDSPWSNQRDEVFKIREMNLPGETEEKIFCKNAMKLLEM